VKALFTMRETRVVRRRPKAAGAVHNGEKCDWCGGGRMPPELFTMGKTQVVRRRPKAAGAVHNGEAQSGAEAAEGRRSCLQWDMAVFTMGFDARLSVKCAFGAFRHGKQIA
jgi:hypothetical protein